MSTDVVLERTECGAEGAQLTDSTKPQKREIRQNRGGWSLFGTSLPRGAARAIWRAYMVEPIVHHGFTYFVEAEGLKRIKIGRSLSDVGRRINALSTGCPAPVKPLLVLRGACLEGEFHEVFKANRVSGEWFKDTAAMRMVIDALTPIDARWHPQFYSIGLRRAIRDHCAGLEHRYATRYKDQGIGDYSWRLLIFERHCKRMGVEISMEQHMKILEAVEL